MSCPRNRLFSKKVWGKDIWGKRSHRKRKRWLIQPRSSQKRCTLADVPSGHQALIEGFTYSIPTDRREHLQAYGVVPGHWVQVIQHSPVTVIQIEHTELALELDLARKVNVEKIR